MNQVSNISSMPNFEKIGKNFGINLTAKLIISGGTTLVGIGQH
jgi:hypothetical protein